MEKRIQKQFHAVFMEEFLDKDYITVHLDKFWSFLLLAIALCFSELIVFKLLT